MSCRIKENIVFVIAVWLLQMLNPSRFNLLYVYWARVSSQNGRRYAIAH